MTPFEKKALCLTLETHKLQELSGMIFFNSMILIISVVLVNLLYELLFSETKKQGSYHVSFMLEYILDKKELRWLNKQDVDRKYLI